MFGVTHPKHDEDYIQTSFSDSRIMYFAGNYGGIIKFSCRLNDDFDFESSSNVTVTVYNKSAKVAVNTIMHNHVYSQEVTTQPTCTQAGEMTYRCECGDSYTEEIAKLGHKEKVTVNRTEPTCTQAGVVTENVCCEICGETLSTKSEPIAAKGHTVVTDKAMASTYAAEGKTQGSHCSECNAVLVAQKTVAKLTVPAIALSKVTTPKSKQLKVTWKKNTKVTGYEVQYSTDKNFKKGNKTVKVTKNKTTSTTIKKLKSKKKYYVRIRTYKTVNGKKYYSAWSKSKNVKVK